jgi:hypothetical protein
VQSKNKLLKLKPNLQVGLFHLEGILDSSFEEDKHARISFYGFVVNFCGAPAATK